MKDFLNDSIELFVDAWNDSLIMKGAIFFIGTSILFLCFLFFLLLQPSEPMQVSGYLVGKEYTPAHTDVGVGSGVGPDGKPVTVITTNSKAEKWTVILDIGGEYKTFNVSANTYYSLPDSGPVTIDCRIGKWIDYIKSCK